MVRTCALGLERLAIPGKPNQQAPGEISAILVDLLLPDQSGMAVLDQIVAATPHVPIVVLSSVDDEAIVKTAMQRGVYRVCHEHGDESVELCRRWG